MFPEASCLHAWFSHREGSSSGRSLQSERDRGRSEFSGVCLRLGPLLNEECGILLITPLWLMSLSADSGVCNKTLLLFGPFFAFLIGLNKRAAHSSSPAIHVFRPAHLATFGLQFENHPTAFFDALHPERHRFERLLLFPLCVLFIYYLSRELLIKGCDTFFIGKVGFLNRVPHKALHLWSCDLPAGESTNSAVDN